MFPVCLFIQTTGSRKQPKKSRVRKLLWLNEWASFDTFMKSTNPADRMWDEFRPPPILNYAEVGLAHCCINMDQTSQDSLVLRTVTSNWAKENWHKNTINSTWVKGFLSLFLFIIELRCGPYKSFMDVNILCMSPTVTFSWYCKINSWPMCIKWCMLTEWIVYIVYGGYRFFIISLSVNFMLILIT